MSPTLRRLTTFGVAFSVTFVADQLTKAWAWANLRDDAGIALIPGVFHLDFAFNTGAAFGVMGGHAWSRSLFTIIGVCAFAIMLRIALVAKTESRLPRWGLGLAAGGALGNVMDRLARVHEVRHYIARDLEFNDVIEHGTAIAKAMSSRDHWVSIPEHGVVDFAVVFYAPGRRWPAFNVADVALSVGGALLMLWLWREPDADPASETAPAGAAAP